ncbi:MAG TPA: alpha/beta fold hydrolase [Micromonosporaceae bacterium]
MKPPAVIRPDEWSRPIPPVHRELISATPTSEGVDEAHYGAAAHEDTSAAEAKRPPVLFVPGFGHGAWAFEEHWLEHTAARGFPAHAMSLRGHGASGTAGTASIRAYAHDVVQVAASLPRQAVLVGHGAGALVVAHALARYPARSGVLLAPVFGGWRTLGEALLRNPTGTLPGAFGGRIRLRRGQLFSPNLHGSAARTYVGRLVGVPAQVQRELLRSPEPERPVGDPAVLVVGSPDDRIVSQKSLRAVASRYGGAPLLFPGMGHDMMLDAGWAEPIDAILDWLSKA